MVLIHCRVARGSHLRKLARKKEIGICRQGAPTTKSHGTTLEWETWYSPQRLFIKAIVHGSYQNTWDSLPFMSTAPIDCHQTLALGRRQILAGDDDQRPGSHLLASVLRKLP